MCPRFILNILERSMVTAAVCSLEFKLVVMPSHVLRIAVAHKCPFRSKLFLGKFIKPVEYNSLFSV